MSQSTIARNLNLSRATINRTYKKFRKLGLIKTEGIFHEVLSVEVNPDIYKFAYEFRNSFRSLAIIALEKFFSIKNIVSNRIVTPLEEIMINNLTSVRRYVYVRGCAVIDSATRFLKKSKRKKMEDVVSQSPVNISSTLKEVTRVLKLTDLGRAKLLTFHDKVLAHCWRKYQSLTKPPKEPFKYFYTMIMHHCEVNDIVFDELFFTMIKKRYKIIDDGIYVRPVIKQEPKRETFVPINLDDKIPRWKLLMGANVASGAHRFFEKETNNRLNNISL